MNPSTPTTIVLIGPMGSGKTTIGRALASRLGRRFEDSDEWIERRLGRTGADLAATEGVATLHEVEAAHAREALASAEPLVVAVAASAIEDAEVRSAARHALTVLLIAPVPVLAARMAAASHRRTLGSDPLAEIQRLVTARLPAWEQVATLTIDTSRTELETAVGEVIARLAE